MSSFVQIDSLVKIYDTLSVVRYLLTQITHKYTLHQAILLFIKSKEESQSNYLYSINYGYKASI